MIAEMTELDLRAWVKQSKIGEEICYLSVTPIIAPPDVLVHYEIEERPIDPAARIKRVAREFGITEPFLLFMRREDSETVRGVSTYHYWIRKITHTAHDRLFGNGPPRMNIVPFRRKRVSTTRGFSK